MIKRWLSHMYGFTILSFAFAHGVGYASIRPPLVAFICLFTSGTCECLHRLRAGVYPIFMRLNAWLNLMCC
jgi:hypothetical protein